MSHASCVGCLVDATVGSARGSTQRALRMICLNTPKDNGAFKKLALDVRFATDAKNG